MTRGRWYLPLAALAGVALFIWTVVSVGAAALAAQLRALAPVLPLILVLAGGRFLLQAAGWRLAIPPLQRPRWREAFGAVVAGEGVGYFAWGPVSREPVKALLVEHRVPKRTALVAAVVERVAYGIAATTLVAIATGIVAFRYGKGAWFLGGLAATAAIAVGARRFWRGRSARISVPWPAMAGIAALAAAQEVTNVVEAFLVLAWLGVSPALTSIVALEGLGRLLNGAGQVVPGKFGITEATMAALAQGLSLGGAHGLSLALARRARSLAWAAAGLAWMAVHAVNWQGLINDTTSSFRDRGHAQRLQTHGVLHRAAAD